MRLQEILNSLEKQNSFNNDKSLSRKEESSISLSNKEPYKKLKESQKIEEELLTKLNLLKDKIKEYSSIRSNKSNEIPFIFSETNPLYTNREDNDPLSSNKLNLTQFNQITYILFKNLQAKGITLDDINEKINKEIEKESNPQLFNHCSSSDCDKLVMTISNKVLILLNCKNNKDPYLLKLFFSALLYNRDCKFTNLSEFFTVLCTYTTSYTPEDEKKLSKKLKKKYRDSIVKLLQSIKKESSDLKYISIIQMKDIIDSNAYGIKDKYIEIIFYIMKKFDDSQALLSNLKVAILEDLIGKNECISSENENESMTEIPNEEYLMHINESMIAINEHLEKNKMTIREMFDKNIKQLKLEDGKGMFNGESLLVNTFLEKIKGIETKLSDMQLSCLCTKYCINDELNYIKFGDFERDLISLKETFKDNQK